MSAPFAIPGRAPRRRIALAALLTVLVALVVSGCAVEKPRALLRVPDGMPASIDYLPGDSMGWVLFDTDPNAPRWRALDTAAGAELAATTNEFFAGQLFRSTADVADDITPWVGNTGGIDVVTSDLAADDATIGFYDVAHRNKLEQTLRRYGFTEHGGTDLGDGPAGDLTYWAPPTTPAPDAGSFPAVAVGDKAMVYAKTRAGLVSVLHKTHQLRAIERRGTNRFTALAVKTTPLAIVYRGDSVREQLLRLVRSDPSTIELARWFATMSVVSASRDGWVGVAPPLDRSRRAVRLVGAFEWSKGQSLIGEPTPVKRVVLDELPASTRVAVAVDDPGSYVTDFLGAATRHDYNFATKLDVPRGEPHVNALELLGQLDGPSALSLTATGRVSARIHVKSPRTAVSQVNAAARLFGLEGALDVTAVAKGQVEIAYEAAPLAAKGAGATGGEAAGVT
ncbi:MAG: hypothetical protein H7287_08895, partial [Thermoleophilia bacterium]|nr:hypothetical protein [Thermoleophilia bacterium]